MNITIQNTSKRVTLNGIEARVWEGKTDSGIQVVAFISRLAVSAAEPPEVHDIFRNELLQVSAPSTEAKAFPLRMIL